MMLKIPWRPGHLLLTGCPPMPDANVSQGWPVIRAASACIRSACRWGQGCNDGGEVKMSSILGTATWLDVSHAVEGISVATCKKLAAREGACGVWA